MSKSFSLSSSNSKRGFLSSAWAMGLLALLVACTSDSYLVVRMVAPTGMTIDNVAYIKVFATNANGRTSPLLQFNTPRGSNGQPEAVSFDDTKGKDFSLQFDHGERGPVKLVVSAFSPSCGCVAEGKVEQVPLNRGGTRDEVLTMFATTSCTNTCVLSGGTGGAGGASGTGGTSTGGAGGVGAGGGGGVGGRGGGGATGTGGLSGTGGMTFPGCDPAASGSCGAGQTCFVNCTTRQGMCVMAGAGRAGSACNGNEDCAPGTQCFDYNGLGCNVKVCLAFCASDPQCTSAVAAGSLCIDPVACDVPTSYRTCSMVCDPRGPATQGCAAGLNCFLFANPRGGEDVADCSCAGNRPMREGDTCKTSNDCVAGTVCHAVGSSQVCRSLCKPGGTDCTGGKTCRMVTNSTVYGVCM